MKDNGIVETIQFLFKELTAPSGKIKAGSDTADETRKANIKSIYEAEARLENRIKELENASKKTTGSKR